MARRTLILIPVLVSLALAGAALAAQAPVAVSPGSASRVALIGDGCPTFSWGAAEGAKSYELVVYRLVEEGEEAPPVLQHQIAGSALGWTPSLDRCLERGGQYAWSVRAESGLVTSEWSTANLFQVASLPSDAEVRNALSILRDFTASNVATDRAGEPALLRPELAHPLLAPAVSEARITPSTNAASILPIASTGVRIEDSTGPANSAAGVHAFVPVGDPNKVKSAVIGEVSGSDPVSIITFGVYGITGSEAGVGVRGDGYSATGSPVGVLGIVNSPEGYGGNFVNTGGGVGLRVIGAIEIVPTDSQPPCTEGIAYFDDSENWLCICDGASFRRADSGALCS